MDGSKVFSTNDTGPVADAVKQHWVDTRLPAGLRPYARLARWERPIGWWLLLWPCFWSAALAAVAGGKAWPDPWHMVLFFIGAVAMRGAGCTYNDLVDVDIDSKVERTRSRPIPAGQVSRLQAKIFLVVQALIGLAVLLQFNTYTIWLGIASLLPVAVYPFMKRITNWPQLFLGFAFSWGALMGWAAAFGSLSWSPVFLYIGGICWTIGYDTIYAHQDKEDDALVGVKSTARLFDEHTKPALILLYSCATALFFLAALFADAGPAAFIGIR
nr:4-hydroxybenzoate octaprenyltransferase [Pseudomonadota bacterium]